MRSVLLTLKFFLLNAAYFGAVPIKAQDPINLFNPEAGQTLYFVISENVESDISTYCDEYICVEEMDRDSAHYSYEITCLLGPENSPAPPVDECIDDPFISPPQTMFWENGILYAPDLLSTGRIDTNGIYQNEMTFPDSGAAGAREYGYILEYKLRSIVFDTLMLSCTYSTPVNERSCSNCDFITTNGYLVKSARRCYTPDDWTRTLSSGAFEKIVQTTPVMSEGKRLKPYSQKEGKKPYNIKGQSRFRRYLHEVPLIKSP